jgi:YbgC/YbaW family acyl-CoA thioester hydrolase
MPFEFESRVRYVDTDASGRIHYTAMLRHFEAAEIELMRFLGLGLTYIEQDAQGMQFPRVHVDCTYTAPVHFEDLLRIRVVVDRVGESSYTLGFDATVHETAVAQGRIVVVCVDIATQRSRPLPEALAEALRRYQTQAAGVMNA